MAFKDSLNLYQDYYTNFNISSFNRFTSQMVTVSLKLPYKLGAKNLPHDIKTLLNNRFWNYSTCTYSPQSEIQTYVNNNVDKCGVDCSGLVYYVLNESTYGAVMDKFKVSYAYGVSADNLSSTVNGTRKYKAKDIVPGCTFRTDNGGHVIVVYDVKKNLSGVVTEIKYAHSNGGTGPHTAYITIGNENEDLNSSSQVWHDKSYTDSQAKNLYNYTILLDCIKAYAI